MGSLVHQWRGAPPPRLMLRRQATPHGLKAALAPKTTAGFPWLPHFVANSSRPGGPAASKQAG